MQIGLFMPLANPFATPEFLLDLGHLAEACHLKGCDYEKIARFREAGADPVVILAVANERDRLTRTLEEIAESMVEPARNL